jgi:hypothetical protein
VGWPNSAFALLIIFATVAVGLGLGRWLRLARNFTLVGVNRALLTIAQGLVLLAILGGMDQRPFARAIAFAGPMALAWGMLTALSPGGEPDGRWWQLWRWRFAPPPR